MSPKKNINFGSQKSSAEWICLRFRLQIICVLKAWLKSDINLANNQDIRNLKWKV